MKESSFDCSIYQNIPQMVLGFHGCDQKTVDRVLNNPDEHLIPSTNTYDWLGDGIYFWLNDPQRAYEWAVEKSKIKNSYVKNPSVIGAVIDIGECLNLCERESIRLLQQSYQELADAARESGWDINEEFKNTRPDIGGFRIMRELDCMVIKHVHDMMTFTGRAFDTVYGYFQEGKEAYPGSDILEKSHIQIAVRNTKCIKGYFLPRLN